MDSVKNIRKFKLVSWSTFSLVSILALIVWYLVRVDGKPLTTYDVFPLFGLLAFSIMWTHYILGSIRRLWSLPKSVNKTYNKLSGVAVLFLILMHPTVLVVSLYRDGFGLPPSSYLSVYSDPMMKTAIIFGTISLVIFLLFELKKWLENKPVWKLINALQLLAMLLIFYHGLTLGGELSVEWYKLVWYFYGLSLLISVGYNYLHDNVYNKRTGGLSGSEQK